jgi:L-asparagine transporter-like permease
MDSSTVLGVVLGVLIGGVYAVLQLSALRKNEQRQQQGEPVRIGGMVPGSMTRVALLLMALVLVQVLVPNDKKTTSFYWSLTISLAVTYSVPFFWKLKDMMSRNK